MTMFVGKTFTGDSDRIVKSFFNSIYDQDRFLWALKLVVDKRRCVVNDASCTEYIDLACRRYVELCPGDAAKVADVLKDRLI